MGNLVTVSGRTLQNSAPSHSSLTYTITATDIKASKALAGAKEILTKKIKLHCECSGTYGPNQTYVGNGDADIEANTARVKCEGESILVEGDSVTINCTGTVTDNSTIPPTTIPNALASITVKISAAGQTNVYTNKA